jgi:hypothetical protein
MALNPELEIKSRQPSDLNTYDQPFFTGISAKLFTGGIWIDDITHLNFELTQQKAPVYGFASSYYDAVAQGTTIVNGTFAIAYREPEYLYHIFTLAMSLTPDRLSDIVSRKRTVQARHENALTAPAPQTIDTIVDELKQDASNYGEMVRRLEGAIWGGGFQPIQSIDRVEVSTEGKVMQSFDLLLVLGDESLANPVVRTIRDVHVTSSRIVVSPDGTPVQEVYSFFGKAAVDRISGTGTSTTPSGPGTTPVEDQVIAQVNKEDETSRLEEMKATVLGWPVLNAELSSFLGDADALVTAWLPKDFNGHISDNYKFVFKRGGTQYTQGFQKLGPKVFAFPLHINAGGTEGMVEVEFTYTIVDSAGGQSEPKVASVRVEPGKHGGTLTKSMLLGIMR